MFEQVLITDLINAFGGGELPQDFKVRYDQAAEELTLVPDEFTNDASKL